MNFIIKPTSFLCNMKCKYCFYLEKENFMDFNESRCLKSEKLYNFMEKRILFCKDKNINFIWQGGEPLLLGLDFYNQAINIGEKLAKKYNRIISHSIQTNGTLIDEAWAKLFYDKKILIGISIDGNEAHHNIYRKMADGKESFDKVISAIKILNQYNVEYNTLTVINNQNVLYPLEVYNFLKSLGVKFMQFIPVVEVDTSLNQNNNIPNWLNEDKQKISINLAPFSVKPQLYADFIKVIFKEWLKNDCTRISIRLFDVLLQAFTNQDVSLCVFKKYCGGENMVLESDGSIYQCDHFVYPDSRFFVGNINKISRKDLYLAQERWSLLKSDTAKKCKICKWSFICNGGCPKHRFIKLQDDDRRISYFCEAYKDIFEYVTPGLNLILEFIEKKIPFSYLPSAVDKLYK